MFPDKKVSWTKGTDKWHMETFRHGGVDVDFPRESFYDYFQRKHSEGKCPAHCYASTSGRNHSPRYAQNRHVSPIDRRVCYNCDEVGHIMRDCPYKNPGKRIVSPPVSPVNRPSGPPKQNLSKQHKEQAKKQAKKDKKKIEKILKPEPVKPSTKLSSLQYIKTVPQNQRWAPKVEKGSGNKGDSASGKASSSADPPGMRRVEYTYVDEHGRPKTTVAWVRPSN